MEQHPIPQDVTGFQFKLIGTMTVKQFGYVAVGAILAVVCWYAPAPGLWTLLTKFILLPLFGLSGVIIAFVPIEGRPVDVMTKNFIHALISPNQYIYIKKGKTFSFMDITYTKAAPVSQTTQSPSNPISQTESKKEQQLRALLASRYNNIKNNLDKKEVAFLQTVQSLPINPSPAAISNPSTTQSIPQQENNLKNTPILQQIQPTRQQKEQAEQELLQLKTQLYSQKSTATPAPQHAPPVPVSHPNVEHVHNIPQNMTKSAGLASVSDTPNVIIGIVKDARGNILSNILVEVKDKNGNPVRAFKTNPLGQFASATPLTNGAYTIELEDPKKQHTFDVIQINAIGQIMLPIEVISHDAREELRKALFN